MVSARTTQTVHDNLLLIQGDCGSSITHRRISNVDLVYADPPFNTGRAHKGSGGQFDDRFASLDAYLDDMSQRIRICCDALAPDGAILLHCDFRTVHHFRILLEDIMPSGFINHLIWQYGLGGSSKRR